MGQVLFLEVLQGRKEKSLPSLSLQSRRQKQPIAKARK